LKDAAALNAIRLALLERLKGFELPVETGSGGLTKYNRTVRELPKAHLDRRGLRREVNARIGHYRWG
jgi:hypothetical protein